MYMFTMVINYDIVILKTIKLTTCKINIVLLNLLIVMLFTKEENMLKETMTLSNGIKIPKMALGVWQLIRMKSLM